MISGIRSKAGIAAGFVSTALLATLALSPFAAFAEDTGVSASADVTASTSTTYPLPPRPGFHPLQTLQIIKKDVLENRDANVKAHLEMVANSSTTPPGVKDRLENRDQNLQNRENKLEDRMSAEKARMMDRIKMNITMMVKRHQAAIDRLTQMITRIESRITKLNAQNVDTSAAVTALTSAKTELAAATADLADISASADAAIAAGASTSTTPGSEPFKPLREKLADSDKHIKAAFDDIKAALKSLLDAAKAAGINVSATGSAGVGAGSEGKTGSSTEN